MIRHGRDGSTHDIAEMLKDSTGFIVVYRLSAVQKCDTILFIRNQGIAETGSHEELTTRIGLYD